MNDEIRIIRYDKDLKIEAYRFNNIYQPFPSHFHEYYVIGYIENGERTLLCRNVSYEIKSGDILLLNPFDSHACEQCSQEPLNYIGLNISKETMLNLVNEVTGERKLSGFSTSVVADDELACYLKPLHAMILNSSREFEKEENLLLLISLLIDRYSQPFESCIPECRHEIEMACDFMNSHFSEHISLEQLCEYSGLSKSTLLRAFTKSKGVTPYRYLQTIRINEAKKLLETGMSPLDAAMMTGFSDQSHFTSFFNMFIGLTPGAYREMFLSKKQNQMEEM